jgi:hypothetical protein
MMIDVALVGGSFMEWMSSGCADEVTCPLATLPKRNRSQL